MWFFPAHFNYAAEEKVEFFNVSPIQPRSFGFQIGDKLSRSIDVHLSKPYTLNNKTLPLNGRITPWLVLQEPMVEEQQTVTSTHYHIQLNYQIINIKPGIHDIEIPKFFISYDTANETSSLLIPAAEVNVSAIINSALINDSQRKLQPNLAPVKLPVHYLKIIVAGCIFFASLLGLAFVFWGLTFSAKKHPFATVYKKLKHHHRTQDQSSYSEALKSIHQAFNETADKTIFAEKLDVFFNENRHYIPLRSEIENYFIHSRKYFFEDTNTDTVKQYSASDLTGFIRGCRNIERGIL